MSLPFALAVAYSPALYRPRERWDAVRAMLVGDAVQPGRAATETPAVLEAYERRIGAAFDSAAAGLRAAELDALVVLVSDHGSAFDRSNAPQIHVHTGAAVWGNPARKSLREVAAPVYVACDPELARFLAEELAFASFDVSESQGPFDPVGDPETGIDPSFVEPLTRLAQGAPLPPVVAIHVNCHVEPCISGERMEPFGKALAAALARSPRRSGVIASGGMSGDPGGYMAGWVDDVLDEWVLGRLRTGRAGEIGPIFNVDSQTLRGSSRELRLWCAAGSAAQDAGLQARVLDYIPFHHAAAGTAICVWE